MANQPNGGQSQNDSYEPILCAPWPGWQKNPEEGKKHWEKNYQFSKRTRAIGFSGSSGQDQKQQHRYHGQAQGSRTRPDGSGREDIHGGPGKGFLDGCQTHRQTGEQHTQADDKPGDGQQQGSSGQNSVLELKVAGTKVLSK